jgi:hypothetical protein
MAVTLCPLPVMQLLKDNGTPAAGYYLYTYQAGQPGVYKGTYTDSTGNTYNPNPIILDSAGRASIWLDGYYYMELWTADKYPAAAGATMVWSQDNVSAGGGTWVSAFTNPLLTGYREAVQTYAVSAAGTTTLADNYSTYVYTITGTATGTFTIAVPATSSAGEAKSFVLLIDNQKSSGTATLAISGATAMQSTALTSTTNGKRTLVEFTSINGGAWFYRTVSSVEF